MKGDSKKDTKPKRTIGVKGKKGSGRTKAQEEKRRLKLIETNMEKRRVLWKRICQILPEVAFNATIACQKIGVTRNTFQNWKDTYEEFRLMLVETQEMKIDWVETMAMETMQNGDGRMIRYFLNNFAQHRGWKPDTAASARINIQNNINNDINVKNVHQLSGEAVKEARVDIEARLEILRQRKLDEESELLDYEDVEISQVGLLEGGGKDGE